MSAHPPLDTHGPAPRPARQFRAPRRRSVLAALVSVAALALSLLVMPSGSASPVGGSPSVSAGASAKPAGTKAKPTIVLVHGAFADSSGWSEVASRLMDDGYQVLAFSNPLRGPQVDGEYLRQFLSTITGPVVLVGHSYGGAVITNAATDNRNVKSLVYVAAYALDEGESVAAANALGGGHTDVTDHLVVRPYPGAPPGDGDAYIDPAFFHKLFAQDLPARTARFLAASQRPGALAALVTPSGPPAWKSIPSWYLVANKDRIIPPEAERAMAKRANARTVSVNSSHVPMMSQPAVVVSLIKAAAR